MKFILITLFFSILYTSTYSQSFTLNFDYSNAEKVLEFLEKDDEFLLQSLKDLEGTKGLLTKNNLTAERYVEALVNKEQTLQFGTIDRHKSKLRDFIAEIKLQEADLRTIIIPSLEKYLPSGSDTVDVTIYLVLGGNSSGFSLGDARKFYVGLHLYKGDFKSVANICKHELFHNIQYLNYDLNKMSKLLQKEDHVGLTYVHAVLGYLFMEGTAEYIADPQKILDDKTPHLKELVEHSVVNNYRAKDVFYLIEKMTLDAYNHPEETKFNHLYSILFDWNWNNPAYYAGYKISMALTEAYGEDVLLKYLKQDPVYFISDYIHLTKEYPEKYELVFSDRFTEVVDALKSELEILADK